MKTCNKSIVLAVVEVIFNIHVLQICPAMFLYVPHHLMECRVSRNILLLTSSNFGVKWHLKILSILTKDSNMKIRHAMDKELAFSTINWLNYS